MLLIVLDCDIIQCIFFQGDMTCRCNYVSFCVLLMCTLNGSLILQAVFHIIVETWEVIGAAPLKMKRKASCCSLKGHQWPLRLQTSRLVSFYIFLHFAIYGILWLSLPYCYLSSSHHGFSVNIAMGTQMYKGEGGLGRVITLHCSVNAGASSAKPLLSWCPASVGIPLVLGKSLPYNTIISVLGSYTVVLQPQIWKDSCTKGIYFLVLILLLGQTLYLVPFMWQSLKELKMEYTPSEFFLSELLHFLLSLCWCLSMFNVVGFPPQSWGWKPNTRLGEGLTRKALDMRLWPSLFNTFYFC